MLKKTAVLWVLLISPGFLWSQQWLTNNIHMSGQIGSYYETYNISGRDSRRPPNAGRLYIRPKIELFGLKFGIEADLFATTEQKYRVQNMNRLGISPQWSWGRADLGDFVPRWTRLTLNGVQTRGAGIKINPGLFRFSVIGGQVFKSSQKVREESFKRKHWGISIGTGSDRGSFLDFMLLSTKDDPDSYTPVDSTTGTYLSPQENVVFGVNSRLMMFQKRWRIEAEWAGSAHNEDVNASEVENEYVSGSIMGLFTPRLSSRADYAYNLRTMLKLKNVNLNGEMKYIGSGYTSLGVSYLLNDRKSWGSGITTKFLQNRLMLRGNFRSQHDNLLGQKRFTTTRNRTNVGMNIRPLENLMLSINTNFNTITNDTDNDTLKIENKIQGYTFLTNYGFNVSGVPTNLNFNYNHQTSNNENALRPINNVVVQTMNTIYTLRWTDAFSTSANFNYSNTDITDLDGTTIIGFGGGVNYITFNRRWSNNLNLTLNNSNTGRTLAVVLSSNFKITRKDVFTLTFRNTGYTPDEEDLIREEEEDSIIPKAYHETIFIVRLTRNF